ncbi:MAG: hypothetical protein CEE38_09105 [Planctomycetes bacterium B3_Pla]|nr:MAG: hypothetical protein CEE38_09105 [Planctomycetes bacterium B3_Pla]
MRPEIAARFFESLAMTRKVDLLSLRGAERRSNLTFFNTPGSRNPDIVSRGFRSRPALSDSE